jgi:hypothetical protein
MLSTRFQIKQTLVGVTGVALCFLLVSRSWAQQPSSGVAKLPDLPNGTMAGRVISSAGEPLVGAVAYVAPVGANGSSQSAAVDKDGNFKVAGLETGVYRASANMPGYITQPLPTGSEPAYYHPGDSVTLTMIKGAVISGTVTGPNGPTVATSVRAVRVRDDEGKAIPSPVVLRERFTDDRGAYRIYGLPSGAYLISAGGPVRFGGISPGAYDSDTPTYFPSATRDTASEIIVRSGEEATADIQYRGEPGHSISGLVAGAVQTQAQMSIVSSITMIDVRDRSTVSTTASSFNNYTFGLYGVTDGEYELYASQSLLPGRDVLRSGARRVTVHGGDVTGISLLLAPLASIEGHLVVENDPKAGCANDRDTAAQETIIFARRYEPETRPAGNATSKTSTTPEVALSLTNLITESTPDALRAFTMRNLVSGQYRIDPRAPASGWYVRSIASGPAQTVAGRNASLALARDGTTLRSGEHLSGLTVTITEGAASLRGRISVAEGQSLPARLRVYVVPAERDSAENVLRFFEARAESDKSFTMGNIAPGRYWIIARPAEESESGAIKLIRQDATLRAKVMREAEALKKEIPFKPCERTNDYDLAYSPAPAAKQ